MPAIPTGPGINPAELNTDYSTLVLADGEEVIPSDSARFAPSIIRAGSAGTLVVANKDGVEVDYGTVAAGERVIFLCTGVCSTGTNVTGITRSY